MNRLLKSLSTLLIVVLVAAIIGCSSTQAPEVEVAPAAESTAAAKPVAAEAPKAEAPKAEAPKAEAPKAEAPKAEAPKAEPAADKVVLAHELAGYKATVEVAKGSAVVTYPAFIPDEELYAFGLNCVQKVPALYDMVSYEKLGDGQVKFYFSEDYSTEDIAWACGLLAEELDAYVADRFAAAPQAEAPKAEPAPAKAAPAPAKAEPAKAAPAPAKAEPAKAAAPVSNLPFGVVPVVKNTQGDTEFDLIVVHTNDVQGRVVPMDDGMGYSKLSTMLKAGRAITKNILVLDAGDTFHGSNYANLFEGESIATLLDMLGYDAVAIGNHDFNYGKDALKKLAKECGENGTALLSANILDESGNNFLQPYALYDYNGFKVVVIGLTTPETAIKTHPKYIEGLSFKDPVILQNAQAAIDIAHKYADYVIVLGHIGFKGEYDSQITTQFICENIKGIDLFVDGHDGEAFKEGKKVGDTLVVSAGTFLQNVGIVQLHVKDNKVAFVNAMLIPAADVLNPSASVLATAFGIVDIPNDPEVDKYIDSLQVKIDEKMGAVVAKLPYKLEGDNQTIRARQTNLSKLVTAALTAETGADFSYISSGSLRASIPAGTVTYANVYDVLPFGNTASICSISGSDIYAALEYGYSRLGEGVGFYPATDLRIVYSKVAEPGKRIKRVSLPDGTVVDKSKTYTVCTSDYLNAGGDGYTQFKDQVKVGRALLDIVLDAIAAQYPAK